MSNQDKRVWDRLVAVFRWNIEPADQVPAEAEADYEAADEMPMSAEEIESITRHVMTAGQGATAGPQAPRHAGGSDNGTLASAQPPLRLAPEASYGSAESAQQRVLQEPHRRRRWRQVMEHIKRKGPAYVTAAVLIIGTAAGLILLDRSASVSLADVQAAVAGQNWVHIRYDNGREEWGNLHDGRRFTREVGKEDGTVVFINPVEGVQMTYTPIAGQYVRRRRLVASAPRPNPWDMVSAVVGGSGSSPVHSLQTETVDGRSLLRLDLFTIDAFGKQVIVEQIWVDPVTRLPVRAVRQLCLADRQAQKRDSIRGEYEFTAAGPASLEDMGVPAGLAVVDMDQPAAQDAQQVIDAGRAAMNRFPARYRAIRTGAYCRGVEQPLNVRLYWRDGDRFRMDSCFNPSSYQPGVAAKGHLDFPAAPEQVLAWVSRQQSECDVYLSANGKSYDLRRRGHLPQVHVMRSQPGMLIDSPGWPHQHSWPYVDLDNPWKLLAESEDLLPGCIALRTDKGAIRRDCIIDPNRDYICLRWIWWTCEDGQWVKERQYDMEDLRQLPTGQWYPAKRKYISKTLGENPQPYENYWLDEIQVLQESDFPAGLFDGSRLLEGAKVVTY